jgi:hypothetical protein
MFGHSHKGKSNFFNLGKALVIITKHFVGHTLLCGVEVWGQLVRAYHAIIKHASWNATTSHLSILSVV